MLFIFSVIGASLVIAAVVDKVFNRCETCGASMRLSEFLECPNCD